MMPTMKHGQIGWWGILHKDGWWVGTTEGALTYNDHEFARVALTIMWQREGGGELHYRIKRFTGANTIAGEFEPKKTALEAINDYEK